MIKRTAFLLAVIWGVMSVVSMMPISAAQAEAMEEEIPLSITAPSVMLLECNTGAVIYEKNADQKRPVASVTKLMTALIVLEQLDRGTVKLNDRISVSPYAAAVTGSQALLDAHASYSLETLLRATIMASGNDSATALAEYIAGTEEAFVGMMNERAHELGMNNTHYVNCTGLPAEGQYTTAHDVSLVALEICKHPLYFEYASVWMDELKHPSGRITDLTNTNRLVRFYQDCDGLKTGSTNEAKYCVCATAERNQMRFLAIVLGAESSQTRFDEARALLDYGFARYRYVVVGKYGDLLGKYVHVELGKKDEIEAAMGEDVVLLMKNGEENQLALEIQLTERIRAPLEKGARIGTILVLMNQQVIMEIPAIAAEAAMLPGFLEGLNRVINAWK